MHIAKKGIRALGIAESFSSRDQSILAGVVMRKDLRIDGIRCTNVTVGGTDATDQIISLITALNRRDIQVILLGGCVIAWFNMIDPDRISHQTDLPVICVTYEDSEGLDDDIIHHFPHDEERIARYRLLGPRTPVQLANGYTIFIRVSGISLELAKDICQAFSIDGKIPEPIRVARLAARAFMRYR
jgi:endonuclease V-like protein UPF0215 family